MRMILLGVTGKAPTLGFPAIPMLAPRLGIMRFSIWLKNISEQTKGLAPFLINARSIISLGRY